MALLFSCALMSTNLSEGTSSSIDVWSVDPLIKVFPDDEPSRSRSQPADVAAGEHASFQWVVRSASGIEGLQATMDPFCRRGGARIYSLPPRFVGYVPVDRPTQLPSKDQLRKPPADYPDPLLEEQTLDVEAGIAQAIWITVPVPKEASPGRYRGTLTLTGKIEGRSFHSQERLDIRVYPVVIDSTRLWVTDWFLVNASHMEIQPVPESDEYYALLRRFARNMAEHRHTVALISPINLCNYVVGADGELAFDFSSFDRWVEIFIEEGVVGRIEGGHIGGRKEGWVSDFVTTIRRVKEGRVVSENVDPSSPAAHAFYARFFPSLVDHLKEKGWLEKFMQHLADEPIAQNISSYRDLAELARKYAPEVLIVEACHTKDIAGAIDIWVPQLNYLHQDFEYYQERQNLGEEVWFYTCVFPQGEYANRFIELPLIKTRLLHWINFKYGITGYLHWGYNHWTQDSPFTHTTRPHGGPPYLPAGDPWIVYPGKDGPLDSIRFEAMRDGIVDHELLSRLAEQSPNRARDLVSRHILEMDKYDTDVRRFRSTRREILKLLSRSRR